MTESSSASGRSEAVRPCIECGQDDPALLYKSGKMKRCYDCQNYANLKSKTTGGGVEFSHDEFLAWKRLPGHRRCGYCGVESQTLYALNVLNPRTKKRFEAVGVDRANNALPYTLGNIIPCCALCNTIKSGLLSHDEMKELGPTLRRFWCARLSSPAPTEASADAVPASEALDG